MSAPGLGRIRELEGVHEVLVDARERDGRVHFRDDVPELLIERALSSEPESRRILFVVGPKDTVRAVADDAEEVELRFREFSHA